MNDKALEWLRQWEALINAADFAGARQLFSPDVVSFGTMTGFTTGLQELETRQWRKVWPNIKDFRFDDPAVLRTGEPAQSTVIISLWHSVRSNQNHESDLSEQGAPSDHSHAAGPRRATAPQSGRRRSPVSALARLPGRLSRQMGSAGPDRPVSEYRGPVGSL